MKSAGCQRQPDAWHDGIPVVVEARVVAADGDHELAGVRSFPPGLEREAAGETHGLAEHPRVLRELRLHENQPFFRREPCEQRKLDRDEGELRRGELGACEPEDRDVEPVAELHRDEDLAGDQHEAREADTGRDPVLPLGRRDEFAHRFELLHRVHRRPERA